MIPVKEEIADRFKNENLGSHWKVDESDESFARLMHYLEVTTNFKAYFEEALEHFDREKGGLPSEIIVADMGSGICWASSLMARRSDVKVVYAVDPSDNRLKHAKFVTRHFGVENKVKIICGTFSEPHLPEKADLILLCSALHHCYESGVPQLFSNIRKSLKPYGKALIANEFYVDILWVAKRLLACIKHARDKNWECSFIDPRAPDSDGNHWRTKKELEDMFMKYGFDVKFFPHKDKRPLYQRLGWHYYCALLSVNTE